MVKEIPESVFLRELGAEGDQTRLSPAPDYDQMETLVVERPAAATAAITDEKQENRLSLAGEQRIVLIGALTHIQTHYEWYKKNGRHYDGWTYKNILTVEGQLRKQIERDGYFILYGYEGKTRGGPDRIQWKLKVDGFEVFDTPVRFDNPVHANDPVLRPYYSKLYFQSIERDDIGLDQLFDVVHNRQLSRARDARRMQNTFIIAKSPPELFTAT